MGVDIKIIYNIMKLVKKISKMINIQYLSLNIKGDKHRL